MDAFAVSKQKDNDLKIVLPFSDFKVNLYNYTVVNKMGETRLMEKVNIK